ncbi:L,D-transpeptidase family protein [Pseudopedobacter saltans]|nr:L,D-transpeptidase family protein [Pseudopedobacter saltans]
MKFKHIFILLSFTLFFLVSCKKYKHEEFGRSLSKAFKSKAYKDFDTAAYYSVFAEQLKKEIRQVHHPKWLNKIYSEEGNRLTLLGSFLLDGGLDSLSGHLSNSEVHGLNPVYFHSDDIANLLDSVKKTRFKKIEEIYPVLARLEILSADGLINYANILKYGAINPKKLYGRYFDSIERPDFIESQKMLEQMDLISFLRDLQPKNAVYTALQAEMQKGLSGDQKERIFLNLERLRWKISDFPEKFILVNIPEFKLRLYDNHKEALAMKVCVGATANPPYSKNGQNHETPVLSGTIDRMQINPVWNIPKSIAGKEIMTKLVENPSYLDESNMVAYDKSGAAVNAQSVDWSSASVDDYSFKQNPGSDNSLGRVKFIFYNPYAIYLHDTPAKQMFNEKNRAVSHGCVRVEQPLKLVDFLLNDQKESEKVKSEITGSDNESRWVKVKDPVKVYLAYYTAFADDKDGITWVDDVYGYDPKLKAALENYLPQTIN